MIKKIWKKLFNRPKIVFNLEKLEDNSTYIYRHKGELNDLLVASIKRVLGKYEKRHNINFIVVDNNGEIARVGKKVTKKEESDKV